jgi:archaellum component FlaC
MATELERLVRDINSLKERVSLVRLDMISKPITPAERQELRKSIESLAKELDTLRAKLDQPPTDVA